MTGLGAGALAGGSRPGAALAPGAVDPAQARAHVRAVVRRSGTSFFWSMRLLRPPERDAMFAIYAFCREVDDVADGYLTPAAKLDMLSAWRREVGALFAGRPSQPTTCALLEPTRRFDLPEAEFQAMVDGMEMDALERMRAPPLALLERYCRCVAGAVGLLSIRVFGARGPDDEAGALALGEALQLTNILRDLSEDARRGRLYLPAELLDRQGIVDHEPQAVLDHPALGLVCEDLAARAEVDFARAERWLAGGQRQRLRPALVMMQVYRPTLARLRARGWRELDRPARLGKAARLWIAVRHGLF